MQVATATNLSKTDNAIFKVGLTNSFTPHMIYLTSGFLNKNEKTVARLYAAIGTATGEF